MSEYPVVSIAVALLKEEGRLVLAWNRRWGAFALPMTKPDDGPPVEKMDDAALRTAAEVLGVPVRLVSGQAARDVRQLWRSGADGEIKDYRFTVVPVEVHPDFSPGRPAGCGVILADAGRLQAEEYRPVSPSVKAILTACMEWGWLP